MALQKIARRDSGYTVVFTVPDFCFVPGVVPPVPFPLFTNLGQAKQTAKNVRINGKPAFVHNASAAPQTFGDQPGVRKGVISRTVGAKAWSKMHSSSVRIHKYKIVRTGDIFMMNGKFKKKFKKSNTCLSCKAAIAIGRPINPILGIKFLTEAPDFTYGGILPLVWQRSYYSDQQGTGWLGQGWATPFSQQLHRSEHGFVYIDEQGRAFPLPDMQADEEPIFHESEQIWFSCDEAGHCFIANLDGSLILRFAPLTVSNDDPSGQMCSQWALVAIEDANGNHQRIIYHHLTGLPQYVIDGNGRVFYLHFGNVAEHKTHSPLWRLTAIYQLPHLPEFNTDLAGSLHHQRALVRYDYAPDGDLIAVYDQSGVLTRSFAYRNHIMVAHTDAAGLVSEYEYDQYNIHGKVVRNWTSLGEEWRLIYHDTYTEVTDILGRTEQYHYDDNNELTKRVFADGSEELMERDHLGRLLSHTDAMGRITRYRYSSEGQIETIVRPDGAMLHFDYDDTYRLIRKSDAEGRYDSYTYDEAGNLLTHTDPLKHTTRFEYARNGLLMSVTDPKGSTTEYHYDHNHQPELITDCSGHQTKLAYTPEGQLAHITDALGQHTEYHYDANRNLTLALYPDGSRESFSYDTAGRLKAHTDAEGHTTAYEYGQDGLPTQRTNALGHIFGYHYDRARRLIGLTNENGARYRFAYDALDRLVAESGFDHKLTTYHYNQSGELVQQSEYGNDASIATKLMAQYGEQTIKSKDRTPLIDSLKDKTPLRTTEFRRDILGRLKHTLIHDSKGNIQETAYDYDLNGNLVRAANQHSITCFDYNAAEQLIGQHQWTVPSAEENARNGLPDADWRDPQYDMLFLSLTQSIQYHYDGNGNRSTTVLPDGRQINHLYYGSGHLHQINLDGETVTDIERDKLHREIQRTQGALTSRYELDPVGRLKKQIAQLETLTEPKGKTQAAAGYGSTAVKRSYGYDKTGNLTHSSDQRTGTTHFGYDKLGRITQAGDERFAFDPAHNILSGGLKAVTDNRIAEYNGATFFYDEFGNTIHKEHSDGSTQNLYYDLLDRLVKAETFKKNAETGEWDKEVWVYAYDALGRRISKGCLKKTDDEIAGSLHTESKMKKRLVMLILPTHKLANEGGNGINIVCFC